MKMKTENFLELCSDIAGAWLNDIYIDHQDELFEQKANGDEVYTESAQDHFNSILDAVEQILESNGITKE